MRRVRTPEGAKYYDAPIGTPITPDMSLRAHARSWGSKGGGGDGHASYGQRVGSSMKAPASDPHAFKRSGEYYARAKKYDDAIAAARGENDLAAIVNEVQNDSLLDDEDYNRVLDAVEAKHNGKPWKPVAHGPAPKAPEKAPAKKPGAVRQAAAAQAKDPGVAPPKHQSAPKQGHPSMKNQAERAIAAAGDSGGLRNVERMITAHPSLNSQEKKDLHDAIQRRKVQLAHAKKKARQPGKSRFKNMAMALGLTGGGSKNQPPKQPKEDWSKKINEAADTGELEMLRAKVNRDSALNDAQKQAFHKQIDNAKGKLAEQDYRDRIQAAKRTADLEDLINEIDADGSLDPTRKSRLYDAISRLYNGGPFDQQQAALPANAPAGEVDPDVRIAIMKDAHAGLNGRKASWDYQGNPDTSPAGKELAKGVDIEKVKNPEGMVEYVHAHPEKYAVNRISNGQVSECFEVVDRKTGKKYFFKQASNGGAAGMWGDGMNEYLAAQLGRAAFPDLFPAVDFGEPPTDGRNPRIRMEHLEEFAKGAKKVHVDARSRGRSAKAAADPTNPLAIHIFDYLIDQTDRHGGNYGWSEDADGKVKIIPMDNGAAFHGYNGYLYEAGLQNLGQPVLPDDMVATPELVGYERWADVEVYGKDVAHPIGIKGEAMVSETRKAYKEAGQGRIDQKQVAKDAKKVLMAFGKVNIDAILADLYKRFPNLNEYEKQHAEAAAVIWKNRIANITAEQVARNIR